MNLRQHLTSAALLGGNQPLNLPPSGSPVDQPLTRLHSSDPTQTLLDSIALLVCYEEAGALPISSTQSIQSAALDPRPICSPLAAGHLQTLLSDRSPLILEWLSLLQSKSLRPPEELIPALLDAATSDRALRSAVTAAAGSIGQWLSRFRSQWAWLHLPALDESVWETGTPEQRFSLLKALRSQNPPRARELAQTAWDTESADVKRQIVETFAANRSLEDEAFLETALDDRSVVVRRAAADQLASIPNSQLGQRMLERLAPRLRLSKEGFLGRTKSLTVEPFEQLDAAMLRDGIDKKPASPNLGERASWTMQALAAVNPNIWVHRLNLSPAQLVEAAKSGEWSALLLEGWRQAAIRHPNDEWLVALMDETVAPALNTPLFRAMSPQAREAAVIRGWQKDAKTWLPSTPSFCNHPWSQAFTHSFLTTLLQNAPKEPTDPLTYQWNTLQRSAAHLAFTQLDTAPFAATIPEFADILNFRRSLRRALIGD